MIKDVLSAMRPGQKQDAVTDAFAPGVLVDDSYKIERVIGRGGMGYVFAARDVPLNRPVAIKVLLPEVRQLAELRKEAAAMAAVQHENVVQVFSLGEYRGHPYVVMEYVPGESLDALIERNEELPLEVVIGVVEQIADGLDAIHARGMAHCDVKPGNILIGPRFRVRLADLGIAQMLEAIDSRQAIIGSPAYIAPEVIDGIEVPPEHRHLRDVYSLGLTTFEMLTGRLPFSHDGTTDDLSGQRDHFPPSVGTLRKGVPAGLDQVVGQALRISPAERYLTCGAFAEALRRACVHTQTQASQRPLQILAVDDEPDIRALYGIVFESAFGSAEIASAEDGLVALELARARQVDLVVADINMPRLDGIELCWALRESVTLEKVPIIVVSAALNDDIRATLEEIGVQAVLEKPIHPRELVSLAKEILGRP